MKKMNDEKIKNKNKEGIVDEEKTINLPEEENEEIVEYEFNEDPEGKSSTSYGAGGEEDLLKKIQKLKSELKACQKERTEYLTGWQKERADFVNYKKQEEDRKANFSESMRERIISRFLTVADSFNMAFLNREAWEKVDENWRRGVEYIFAQFNTILEEYGVKEIGSIGEKFDPNIHQSVEVVPTEKKEDDHKVCEVIQKGYCLGERVIRAARVKIFEHKLE